MRLLENIRIVLVEPTHPGNIGAVARAMKTMGMDDLVMVKPKKFPHYEASKRAAGAASVLDNATVVESLEQAIGDCTLVAGTSVRDREVQWPTNDPKESADIVIDHLQRNCDHTAALVFGRESSGMTNEELDLCQFQVRIPANTEYSSLNLASAVQIVAYELRMKSLRTVDEGSTAGRQESSPSSAGHPPVIARKEPSAITIKEPSANTVKELSAITIKEPPANTVKGPSAITIKEPSANTIKEPSANTIKEPSAITIKEPAATQDKQPSAIEIKDPSPPFQEAARERRLKSASRSQQSDYIKHLQSTLEALDFIHGKPPTMLMRKLTRLYNKAELTVEEIQILRGILTAIDSKIG